MEELARAADEDEEDDEDEEEDEDEDGEDEEEDRITFGNELDAADEAFEMDIGDEVAAR